MRLFFAVALAFAGAAALDLQPAAAPAFEVASVRHAPQDARSFRFNGGPGTKDPERFIAENISFLNLVMSAYDLKPYQVQGPGWMSTERYNVTAKVPAGATKDQFRVMLRGLLAERFALKVHRETREMLVYSLVVAKGGPKLQESAPEEVKAEAKADDGPHPPLGRPKLVTDARGFPVLPPGDQPTMIMVMGGKSARRAHRESTAQMAVQLSVQLGSPVIDATGLTGAYDYTLYWIASPPGAAPRASVPADSPVPATDPDGPDLFEAVQQQLGLKLEPRKGPVEMLVVDRAEKNPAEN